MALDRVLIIEQDEKIRELLQEMLKRTKREVVFAENGLTAQELLKLYPFDLIFCSWGVAENKFLNILKSSKSANAQSIFILIIPSGKDQMGIEALHAGAFAYLQKPLSSKALEAILQKAQEHATLVKENDTLRQEISSHPRGHREKMIAESSIMKRILADVIKISKSNASVFISGESGTGKEVIAHAIHFASERAGHPFIKVNCAAIPDTLIESEFFGHEKGAFTGALQRRSGRFELAHLGTLLLDEITEIPLAIQAKLLRAIQEQEFERVGGTIPLKVDVRIISTSNREMKEAIDQKLFREDLYYRLNVMPIHLPPLRERKEDILPLAEYFLQRLCLENHKSPKHLSSSSRKKLLEYFWPGNIRELANIIERTVVMDCADIIEPEHLYLDPLACKVQQMNSATSSPITLSEIEKKHILKTLSENEYNKMKTAHQLGISVRTLRNKLKDYSRDHG